MKKQYVQPMMEVETMDMELPIAASMDMKPASSGTLDGDEDFLSKDRNIFSRDHNIFDDDLAW